MMKRALLLAALLLSFTASAAADQLACMKLSQMKVMLDRGWSPVGRGVLVGNVPAVLMKKEDGAWMLLLLLPDRGLACVRDLGDGWLSESVPAPHSFPPGPRRRT